MAGVLFSCLCRTGRLQNFDMDVTRREQRGCINNYTGALKRNSSIILLRLHYFMCRECMQYASRSNQGNGVRMDEQALINAVRQGDLDAFNLLVLHYQSFLFNIALRMMGSEDCAADALQNALLSAFRKFNSFRGGSFPSWLARVVIHTSYPEPNRHHRHPFLL